MNRLITYLSGVLWVLIFLLPMNCWGQVAKKLADDVNSAGVQPEYRHSIEIFPLVAFFQIYSAQYTYAMTPKDHLISGFAYLNINVEDRDGNTIGRFHSPTITVGYRRFVWKNLHAEYQLWPAYSRYFEKNEEKYYTGFDLYNEFRAGYLIQFEAWSIPVFINPQYAFGFGLLPGNKPDSFIKVSKDNPVFHAPTVSIGVKF